MWCKLCLLLQATFTYQHISTFISIFHIYIYTSTYINTYQHTSTHISTDQHLSTYINTHHHISQQHISTQINIYQHGSTCINIYQHTSTYITAKYINIYCINTYQPFLLKPPKLGNWLIKTLFCPPQRQMFRSFAQQLESSLKKSWVAKDDHVGKPATVIYWFCNYQDVFFCIQFVPQF